MAWLLLFMYILALGTTASFVKSSPNIQLITDRL